MKSFNRYILSTFLVFLTIASVRSIASAQILVTTDTRCANAVGVSTTQAAARYAWALHCYNNVPMPPPGYTYTDEQWLTDASIADHDNPLNAGIKDHLFPIYYNAALGTIWNAPDSATADCMAPVGRPIPAFNVGLCTTGCYVENTPLQFADGAMGIKAAWQAGKADLVTLAPAATLDNLQFVNNTVKSYSVDVVDEWQTIHTFSMKSGGQLHVTSEHPLLTADGVIRQAKSLKRGDELVRATGKPDPIVKIAVSRLFGKVYNVKPVTTDYTSNIVIAGGYLNGSVRYQNEFLDMVNSLILRRALTSQAGKLVKHHESAR